MTSMNSMSSRDRMGAVLSGSIPDRVPFLPTIAMDHACTACGRDFVDALVNPAVGVESMLGAARRYGADAVRLPLGPDASWYEEKEVVMRDGKLVQLSRDSGKIDGYFDVAGGGGLIPLDKPEAPSTVQEVEEIPVRPAAEYIERGCLVDLQTHCRAAHEEGLFVIGMCSSQTLNFMVATMGKPETALLLFLDDPVLADALIDKAVALSIEKGKAMIDSGVDCLYIGDSYATASVISPTLYKRFCVPAYTRTAAEFKSMGVFCYQHCCGNYNPLLDSLPSIGLDAMDGIDPTSGMSVGHTKERIGTELTLMGGLSCLTLIDGTPEQVYEEAAQCIAEGMAGGRYVLGSACAVPRYTPVENMMAARQAALDCGNYPTIRE
jgi:uroporphyrinogen-III decarboxylase